MAALVQGHCAAGTAPWTACSCTNGALCFPAPPTLQMPAEAVSGVPAVAGQQAQAAPAEAERSESRRPAGGGAGGAEQRLALALDVDVQQVHDSPRHIATVRLHQSEHCDRWDDIRAMNNGNSTPWAVVPDPTGLCRQSARMQGRPLLSVFNPHCDPTCAPPTMQHS